MSAPQQHDAIREMEPEDVQAMADLEARVSHSPWSAELFAGELRVAAAERHWVVAHQRESATLLGFGGIMFVPLDDRAFEGHIMNMAVDPDHQGNRLGTRILHRLVGVARDRGVESLTLEVRVGNEPALALYRRFGFGPVGVRPRYYGDGSDALVMWVHDLQSEAFSERLNTLVVAE